MNPRYLASKTPLAEEIGKNDSANAMNETWRETVRDVNKLDGIVNAMAHCMARLLSIRDDEVDGGKTPLGRALYEEKEHFPSQAQLDEVENIARAVAFAQRGYKAALELRATANSQTNVRLDKISNHETFMLVWKFNRPECMGKSRLKVGGLCGALYESVLAEVQRWLLDCDAAMMIAANDVTREAGEEIAVVRLAHELAESIATRLALVPTSSRKCRDLLSTEALQLRTLQELSGTTVAADERHRTDMLALRALYTLAHQGAGGAEGGRRLEELLPFLQYIVKSPPVELGTSNSGAEQMNIRFLARACAPGIDAVVRQHMVHQWRELHGAFAATAALGAIQRLEQWYNQKASTQTFVKVLYTPTESTPSEALSMPRMPFVHTTHRWRLMIASKQRSPHDWIRRRCVRLSSLVLQLLGHGALEPGVVSSQVVGPIADEATLEASVVLRLLDQKREQHALGTRLLLFCGNVSDYESHLSPFVADSLSHISRFSLIELLSVFSRQSPAMRVIIHDLTFRTRVAIGNYQTGPVVPRKYLAFVYDFIPILLQVLTDRRGRLGLSLTHASNPICELLRALPASRSWTPLQGTLHLTMDDLKEGPPSLVYMLRALSQRGLLVDYKRPHLCNANGSKFRSPKNVFVFDTAQLVAVLSGYQLVSMPQRGAE